MINTTPFTNYSGNLVVSIGSAINTESGGLFGILILVGIYLIIFVPGLRFGPPKAFASSAFVGGLVAILLRLLGWISDPILYIAIVLMVIGMIVLRANAD